MYTKKTTSTLYLSLIVSIIVVLSSCQQQKKTNTASLKLWYQQPANASVTDDPNGWKDDPEWLKALPLGNGSLGAMVFGDVNKERIQLNEESMWSGSVDNNDNPDAYPAQAAIRKLLFEGKYKEATTLTQQTQIAKGKGSGRGNGATVPFGCFQTLGDLWLDFEKQSSYENYHRELDLDDAVVRVSYTQDGVKYKREIFVSQPDQVMVIKLSADKPGTISFKSSITRPEKFETIAADNQLIMHGALSDGNGGAGLQYMARLSAVNKNGTVQYKDTNLIVENADEVTLILTASTDHVLEFPNYNGRAYKTITQTNLQKAKQKSFETLLKTHKEEYQRYYNRVSFSLGSEKSDLIPTDLRIQKFKESKSDLHLVELLFQYGRYLLISSSRPGTLPANLQGIWANKIQTPWNGDYHTDVNVQMNYWLAETTNLGEMHLPLFNLLESIQEPGAKTAKTHYNANGWVIHPITNVWGYTSPGELASWGMHVGGGAWLTTHIMEHYYFTLDKDFLKQTYPILKASTQFYMDWLVPDPKTGELLSGPSVSPENTFLAPDGSKSQISMGPAHDHQVIWQLFKNFIDASNSLEIENDFLQKVIKAQGQLAKPKIGADGRLMEWNEEFKELEPGHRHISHMFALHPGYQIDVQKTPELALAAKKSLDFRIQNGGGHTGWSAAWLINQYARLGEAENARQSLNTVLSKSTSPNLFGLHPPFQMDANFGATAGIAEMLLQSQSGEIRLLPALPKEWKNGEIKGLCARGGFVVDMKWGSGELVNLKVFSKNGGNCKIEYKGKEITFETESGKEYFPLKEGKHLFILSGQSNMMELKLEESFIPAIEAKFGKENVLFAKDALGTQPIRRWYKDWKPLEGDEPKAQPDLYDSLMVKVNKAIENKTISTVTFIWMQGERDAFKKFGGVYERSLKGLHQQLSNDLNRTDVNFVIGRLSDFGMSNKTHVHWTMVRDIQVKVAESNSRFDWINTDDLNDGLNREGKEITNGLHMSAQGYVIMGERFAGKSIQLIENNK